MQDLVVNPTAAALRAGVPDLDIVTRGEVEVALSTVPRIHVVEEDTGG
jgi:hypothetical protein